MYSYNASKAAMLAIHYRDLPVHAIHIDLTSHTQGVDYTCHSIIMNYSEFHGRSSCSECSKRSCLYTYMYMYTEVDRNKEAFVTHNYNLLLQSVLESKVLMQRQSVYFIPVYEVTGTWKTEEFSYWVYGYDHSAHCSDYPGSTCDCSNCTLL